jgi:DNA-binding transcriptional ArsR family regulator
VPPRRSRSTQGLNTLDPHGTVLLNRKVEQGVDVDDQLSRVFSALADPTRRDMVARLTAADATVNELAEPYDVSVQAVSKHLKVLEEAGLVSRSREAQRRPVHLEAEVFDLMTKWIERYRRRAEERYRRLDDVLAEMETEQSTPRPDSERGAS